MGSGGQAAGRAGTGGDVGMTGGGGGRESAVGSGGGGQPTASTGGVIGAPGSGGKGAAVGGGGGDQTAGTRGTGGGIGATGGNGGFGSTMALFRRGINLGNRLDAPTEGAWGPSLNAADFPRIAQRGFDHIRLPVRFSGHASASAPYTIDPVFLARVDWAIKQALDAHLAIIVDLHHYDEIHLDPAAHQDRFVGIWTELAAHYRDQPAEVAFELLNEPSGALNATWNTVAARALAAVRQTNPTRLVIIDSSSFAATSTLPALQINASNDRYIVASVHMYEPSLFSFQGQAWMGPIWATTTVIFPGPPATPLAPVQAAIDTPWAKQWFTDYNNLPTDQNPSGPKIILSQVQQAKDFTQRTGLPVYNGEWGPQNGGDIASRARYMRSMREECERAGITWAIWEDASNMKLFDSATGVWDATLTAPLFQ